MSHKAMLQISHYHTNYNCPWQLKLGSVSLLPVLMTLVTFLPEKHRLSPAKNVNSECLY